MSLAHQTQQWFPTSVQVVVHQARNLRIKGKHGTNDAYAIMQVAKERFATGVVEKTVSPVWKEEASFDLPPVATGSALRVHVMHRALVGPDKLLGQAVINLLELSEIKSRDKTEWFKLLDKAGKADKDRGEVLVSIQFMRNNMTASMFDLSATEKPRSRLGKLKDKVRGKKREGLSDSASAVVPSFTQVLTDSEGEGEGEAGADKEENKKKHKLKSLFSTKSNLQRNMSQSMSVLGPLPERSSSLTGVHSSGLNQDSSEGKKKFKFLTHKRTSSSDSKGSQGPLSFHGPPKEQSNLCINGSHVYTDEPPPRRSRTGSTFSLASSGHGSMEDLRRAQGRKSSTTSVDSLRGAKQPSPWAEESPGAEEEEQEEITAKSVMEQQLRTFEEEEKRLRREEDEERARGLEEEGRLRRLEEERVRGEERERKRLDEERRIEEEKRRVEEEQRAKKEEEEEKRRLEEKRRIEEEKRREEEERIREELERKRMIQEEELIRREEEERAAAERNKKQEEEEERVRLEKEENERLEEQRRNNLEEQGLNEEEGMRREEVPEIRREEEERQREEQERRMMDEEERARREEDELRKVEERRREEEEERLKLEDRLREEEEGRRKEEERRREEEERTAREEEERTRRKEEERIKREGEERTRREEEERKRKEEEEERLKREDRLREEERKRRDEEEERRRRDEEERVRKEEEECRLRKEEEERKMRDAKEKMRGEEERRKEEEDRQREEERLRLEEEEEERRKEERERIVASEKERLRKEGEERVKLEEERREREERERVEELRRKRMEEEERARLEEERKEEKRRRAQDGIRPEVQKQMEQREITEKALAADNAQTNPIGEVGSTNPFEDVGSTNPFEEDGSTDPYEETASPTGLSTRTTKVSAVKPSPTSCALLAQPLGPSSPFLTPSEPGSSSNPPAGLPAANASRENPADVTEKKRRAPLPPDNRRPPPNLTAASVSPAQAKTANQAAPLSTPPTGLVGSKDDHQSKAAVSAALERSGTPRDKRPAPQPPGNPRGRSGGQADQTDQCAQKTATPRSSSMLQAGSGDHVEIPSATGGSGVVKYKKGPAPSKPLSSSLGEKMGTNADVHFPENVEKHGLVEPSEEKHNLPRRDPPTAISELNPFAGSRREVPSAGSGDKEINGKRESLQSPSLKNEDVATPKSVKTSHAPSPPVKVTPMSRKEATGLSKTPKSTEPLTSGLVGKKQTRRGDVEQPGDSTTKPPGGATSPVVSTLGPPQIAPKQGTLLQAGSQACEVRPMAGHCGGGETDRGKRDKPASNSRRPHPVKPLGSSGRESASSLQGAEVSQPAAVPGGLQEKIRGQGSGVKGPFSQLTPEELVSLVVKQQRQLTDKDRKITELEQYIDNLLVRVIEEAPCILMSLNSLKK